MTESLLSRLQFDPADPFDAASDAFRQQVVEMAARAFDDPAFKALDPASRMAALIGGTLTGLLGVVFVGAAMGSHDYFMDYIKEEALPFARKQAEAILNGGAP